SFKEIWKSDRYWEVINLIASDKFDARTMCGSLCLQHKANEFLWDIKNGGANTGIFHDNEPMHVNFI
ncbi:MAG: radical SAM protein, partial [Patescibacteria group bacterium]